MFRRMWERVEPPPKALFKGFEKNQLKKSTPLLTCSGYFSAALVCGGTRCTLTSATIFGKNTRGKSSNSIRSHATPTIILTTLEAHNELTILILPLFTWGADAKCDYPYVEFKEAVLHCEFPHSDCKISKATGEQKTAGTRASRNHHRTMQRKCVPN